MTVAYDTSTTKGETTGDSTWSHTAGASNIQGALVYIIVRNTNTPPVGVTYGGTAMAKVTEANDTAGETGNVTAWFLSNPGNGSKTVSVDVGASDVWIGAAITCTGATGLKTYVGTPAQENQANPSSTLTVPTSYVNYPSGAYFYGAVNAGVSAGTNYTKFGAVDYTGGGVSSSGNFERYTTGTVSGNPTVNFTAATDDCAMVAVTMGEPAANAVTHVAPQVVFGGGAHFVKSGRTHTASVVAFTGGTHTAKADHKPQHTAANAVMAGGSHFVSTRRVHAAAQMQIAGGTHTADYVSGSSPNRAYVYWAEFAVPRSGAKTATLTAAQVVFGGGAHTTKSDYLRAHAAANLVVAGGTHTASHGIGAVNNTESHTAAQVVLAGGAAATSRTTTETAAAFVLAGGTDTASAGRPVPHTAAQMQIAGGSAFITTGIAHTAPELLFAGGVQTIDTTGRSGHFEAHTAAEVALFGGDHGLVVTVGSQDGGSFVLRPYPKSDRLTPRPRPPRKTKILEPVLTQMYVNAGHMAIAGGSHAIDYEEAGLLLLLP